MWRVTLSAITAQRLTPISIHTLRVEGDDGVGNFAEGVTLFLSTPSVWRVTIGVHIDGAGGPISIHTLRVEGDQAGKPDGAKRAYFYPHPPCGG